MYIIIISSSSIISVGLKEHVSKLEGEEASDGRQQCDNIPFPPQLCVV